MKQDQPIGLEFLDAVSSYILVFDQDGIIQAANKQLLDALGMGRDEISGMSLEELAPRYRVEWTGKQSALQGKEGCCACSRLLNARGLSIPIEQTLSPVHWKGRELIVCAGNDISGLVAMQQQALQQQVELHRAKEELKAANRMKSEFIANMNHEIRTPMNAIIGYSEMLYVSDLGERDRRFVKTIRKNGATLISILNDIMELSKLESGSVRISQETTSLQSLLDEVSDLFVDQLSAKNLEYSCLVQADLPEFFVLDKSHCRQILRNLLSNAVKFTNRGRVQLSVSGTRNAGDLFDLDFQVIDTGIGINRQEQDSIFDLFSQSGSRVGREGGKRLGLTLCARLALLMGGRITLDSGPGRGSSFTFSLPAEAGGDTVRRMSEPAERNVPAEQRDKPPPLVLVVDDMPMITEVICDYFDQDCIEILVAGNSDDGLELARSRRPELILMDLNLAGTDGREVTGLLRQDSRTADIPVVVMTGRMLDEKEYKPLFDDFLAKPFHLDELQRVVDRFVSIPPTSLQEAVTSEGMRPVGADKGQVGAAWDQELASLLLHARVSGSLDAARNLGLRMYDRGEQLGVETLMSMGRQLQEYAVGPDILGIEQLLALLAESTGEFS